MSRYADKDGIVLNDEESKKPNFTICHLKMPIAINGMRLPYVGVKTKPS